MIDNKNWRKIALIILILSLSILVSADTETLDVSSCSGATICSVSGLNSDTADQDGADIDKGEILTTGWTDTTFNVNSTIDQVDFIITHSGDAGITGTLEIIFQNTAGTVTYCTDSISNVQNSIKETRTPTGCSWTKARLDDLEITIENTDDRSPSFAYLSFLDMDITYTPPDLTGPNITLENPENDTFDFDGNVDFNYTPTDISSLDACELYVNSNLNKTENSPQNNSVNNFTLTGINDGTYDWFVSCNDTATNVGNSSIYTIKIDTTGPVVNLESPSDNNISTESQVAFFYNASDFITTLNSCELIIDDSSRKEVSGPAEDTTLNFTSSLSNGQHFWSVNCTDQNNFESASLQRNITINVTSPTAIPGDTESSLGQTAEITGENWNPSVEVTFNYTLPNGTSIIHTNTTTGSGTVADELFVNYTYPTGTVNLLAYQTSDPSENATSSFNIVVPDTTLSVDSSNYGQGDKVFITGTNYTSNSVVNITITFSDSSTDNFTAPTDSNGAFSISRNLSYSAPTGLTNITGWDSTRNDVNGTNNFTVDLRLATMITNQSIYGRNNDVNFSGYNFTRQGTVEVAIYDNETGAIGSGFPKNVSTDNNGFFYDIWNTGDTCNGVYRIEGIDQNRAKLNTTTYFNISEINFNEDNTTITSGFTSTDSSPIDVSLVNDSDDQDETQSIGGSTGQTLHYELNFTNNFAQGTQVFEVLWTVEHAEPTGGLSNPQLEWWNGSQYVGVACSDLSTSTTDVNNTCNLTQEIDTREELNFVSLRFQLTKSGGGTQISEVDFTQLEMRTGFEPVCTYFNGSSGGGVVEGEPIITGVIVDDGITTPEDEIDLNAGTTKDVLCNVTVQDDDGYTDISNVNATFYSSSSSLTSPDNSTNHYTNSSCSFVTNPDQTTAIYDCSLPVQYYAENTTWTCFAEATDGTTTNNGTDTATINPLFALNVSTSLIDYGNVSINATSQEQLVNVSNIGNSPINVSVLGFGGNESATGDGLAMVCQNNNISIENERFATTSGIAFNSKKQLNSSYQDVGFTISEQTNPSLKQKSTFWQLFVPDLNPILGQGQCNGTVIFQAEQP